MKLTLSFRVSVGRKSAEVEDRYALEKVERYEEGNGLQVDWKSTCAKSDHNCTVSVTALVGKLIRRDRR